MVMSRLAIAMMTGLCGLPFLLRRLVLLRRLAADFRSGL